ncbi:D-alanyl-D-alanine carboxypeptidase family protein [Rivibacter subsaxonicus]|uniref:serine-type D-Ala-D-Ala carboxypeptidase n=1 Tax=Rivibacter subsaxonicus TaxID=457575 RepID=A0A4Q7VVA3_9BURK|nr:D-alanyl-D-alanine carboxypeptidase family protein [Rivibacter subsaxonicus]RZU00560.1 penicillin-binding protein 6 [Rivibacter subsaxonicus]
MNPLLRSLVAGLALAATAVGLLPAAQAQVPQAPEIAARSWLLLDLNTGQALGSREPDQSVEPASLTKLMSAYVVFQALRDGKLSLEQTLPVSERAWRTGMTGASRSYLPLNSQVKVDDLLKGMIVQSGNDATVVLAEGVGGSVENFVAMMNRQGQAFGLKATSFKNPEGLTAPGHMSTARELGVIATRLIKDFPEYLPYYSIKEFTFNKIKQPNRNLLLYRDPSVDGLKTGYTDNAGYCLIATARRDFPNGQRRLLSVVLGAASMEGRAVESQKLLNWGYGAWDAVKLFDAGQSVAVAPIWKGSSNTAKLGSLQPIYVNVPRGAGNALKTDIQRTDPLVAPLAKGAPVGKIVVRAGDATVAEVPLVALEGVESAGIFGRAWDSLRLWIK